MNIPPDHISESLETMFWVKNTLILLCGAGFGIRNPFDPGSGINIPDPRHCLQCSHMHYCAAKAIFYCPTMNSHRPRSQNTSKEQALILEKESRRTWPRCHVSLEKSSKNHKPLEKWAKPNLSPDVTPRPANFYVEYFRRICHVMSPDPPELFAVFSRHPGWPN